MVFKKKETLLTPEAINMGGGGEVKLPAHLSMQDTFLSGLATSPNLRKKCFRHCRGNQTGGDEAKPLLLTPWVPAAPKTDHPLSWSRVALQQHGEGGLQRRGFHQDLSSGLHKGFWELCTTEPLLLLHFRPCFLQRVSSPRAKG